MHLDRAWAFVVAGTILTVAVLANLAGLRVGSRVQLALAAGVALALVVTVAVSVAHMTTHRLTPFAPHGYGPVAAGVIVLFFAFAGWEAVAHLVGEFTDPDRDVPRAVTATIAIVTTLYLGIAAAVVLTGTYGSSGTDHVAIELLLQGAFGNVADVAAAAMAVVISLGTTNAFVAGVSRLGYSLANDGWLPRVVAQVNARSVPIGGVLAVGLVACGGLAAGALFRWGTETLVVVPSTLVVAVYLLAATAGVRLLDGFARTCAVVTIALTLLIVPAAAHHAAIPGIVAALAMTMRCAVARRRRRQCRRV
jgi:amino acid efflux transporter